MRALLLGLGLLACGAGCQAPDRGPEVPLRVQYTGSSTVALFLRDAEPVFERIQFVLDTAPESAGGEAAILGGVVDLAGIADAPSPELLRAGVAATLFGHDAIALIVHANNPVTALSREQLAAVFTGRITRWEELGGPDLDIHPLIVGEESATHRVLRRLLLRGEDYVGCEQVRPDADLVRRVAEDPAAIGTISFSFLNGTRSVRALTVDGQRAEVTNLDYPIKRPLYLLRRDGNPRVDAFADWALSDEGQRVVMQRFVGVRPIASVSAGPAAAYGSLKVYTDTRPVYDGGVYYYPHLPYEILSSKGQPLRVVPNHRGDNDERPTRVSLQVGTYLIRTRLHDGESMEFYVTIEAGRTLEVDLDELRSP